MEWYLPITILPGIGMIILSTVHQVTTLSQEISGYQKNECDAFQKKIARRKIHQLGLLTRAVALLYVSVGAFVLSGILAVILPEYKMISVPSVILFVGTFLILASITLLITYAFRAVNIRRLQFEHEPGR